MVTYFYYNISLMHIYPKNSKKFKKPSKIQPKKANTHTLFT